MSIERRNFPQFFITAPSPCPYLPGRQERKVFTHIVGPDARHMNSQLSQGGFRRSQNIAYRPACDGCHACQSVRIPVESFLWSRGFRRVLASNADVTSSIVAAKATSEQYSLFRAYIDTRHAEGGMANMTVLDYAAMVDDNLVDSRVTEFRLRADHPTAPRELVGAALLDVLSDGLSMIYSFYEPTLERRSLGTLMILDTIQRARRMGLPYVYLGFLVKESPKMAYKGRFLPQERLGLDGWTLHRS
ncbi:MAG: arginyltransferase [Hyphomicrobiales bacterium]